MYLKKSIHFAASCQTFFQISFHSFCFIIYHSIITNKSLHTILYSFYSSSNSKQQPTNQPTNQPIREQFHSIYNEGFIVPLFSFSIKLINSRSRFHSHFIHIYLYAEFVLCRVSISNRFRTQISFPLFTITFLHSLLC